MIKAWDYVYEKCKDCKQNIPGTGRSVTNYAGYTPMTNCELEKIRYIHHKTFDKVIDTIAEQEWIIPVAYIGAAVVLLYFWIAGVF